MENICLKVETLYFIMAEMCLSEVNVDNCVFNLAVNSNNKLAFVISFFEVFHLFTANQRMVNKRQTTDSMAVY